MIKRIDYEMVQLGWTTAIALVVGKEEVGDDLAIKCPNYLPLAFKGAEKL